jgi:hypothetical protein
VTDIDNTLEFWFRILNPGDGALARVICLAERDNVFHVESRFRGKFWSADPERGVRALDDVDHQSEAGYWDVVCVAEQVTDALAALVVSELGQAYDFTGAIDSALGIPIRNPYRWFCSELAYQVAIAAGIVGLDPLPSPSKLRRQVKAHVGIVSASPTGKYPVAGLVLGDNEMRAIDDLVAEMKIAPETAARLLKACS